MAWWRRQDRGSTSSIGLSVAAALFAIAFMTANLMVAKPGGVDHGGVTLDLGASTALDVIIGQGGRRAATSAGWITAPDDIGRFGLASDGEPNFLDYVKIKSVRNATMTSTPNNAPDYPDVRESLGMTTMDFHLRTYPVIPGLDDPRWVKDPRGRVAYFGHYSGASAAGSMAAWANVTADGLNVSLAIRNDDLKHATFAANVGLGNVAANTTSLSEQRHTKLLAPGEVQTVWFQFPKMKGWSASFTGVKVDLSGPYGNTLVVPYWLTGAPPTTTSADPKYGVTLHSGQMYYVSGDKVEFTADHFDSTGEHVSASVAPAGTLVIKAPNGTTTSIPVTLPTQKNKAYTYSCTTFCTGVGNYTAVLTSGTTPATVAYDTVHVSAAKMFDEKQTLDPLATKEIALVSTLVTNFAPTRYHETTNPGGDVFGDDSNGPNEVAELLSRYTILVVGSEVSQTALNAAVTKYAIADWVQAGGVLIVLGTVNQQSNWLEPIYHAAQITANGGIGTPDPTHPVLHSPNRLDYQRYLDRGRAWDVDADAPFTHVLTRSAATGDSYHDTLGIAAPGAYNEGTVILTSYMPGAITSPQDDEEARRFLHNMFSQAYNMLFLDFGPSVPDDVPVGSAQRLVAVPHPNVPGAVVEVGIVMYTWH